jgi:hypothetical protein
MAANVDSKFPGAEKHETPIADAKRFIQNHRKNPKIPNVNGGSFHRGILDKILAQKECDGIRFYFAQSNEGTATLVGVGITAAGTDMTKGTIAEAIKPCPPYCDVTSELQ